MTLLLVSLSQLPRFIRLSRHSSRWVVPLALDYGPSLSGRIRGAWGRRIMSDKDAQAVFFSDKLGQGAASNPPFLIAADMIGEELVVTLTLIGTARRFMDVAFDAMEMALGQEPGLDFGKGKKMQPLHFVSSSHDMISGLPQRALGREEYPDFFTPVKIGPRGVLGSDFSDVIFSIADRAAALAIHESIEVPRERSLWRDIAKAQNYDASKLVAVPPWQAWSSNGGAKLRLGYLGRLTIVRPTPELEPILALGAYLHAGAHAAEGFGRFRY
jgi:hypothetical protein